MKFIRKTIVTALLMYAWGEFNRLRGAYQAMKETLKNHPEIDELSFTMWGGDSTMGVRRPGDEKID
jgi:hypothetical protein